MFTVGGLENIGFGGQIKFLEAESIHVRRIFVHYQPVDQADAGGHSIHIPGAYKKPARITILMSTEFIHHFYEKTLHETKCDN